MPSPSPSTSPSSPPPPPPPSIPSALLRGARGLCPRCGQGRIFSGWYDLHPACPACGLVFEPNPGDTWGLTYIGTAAITGLFAFVVFLVRAPRNWMESALYLAVAGSLMIGTAPHRKGVAVAILYLATPDPPSDPTSP